MASQKINNDGLRAGVIGLGQIGGGVAISLARRKRALSVFDVHADAAARLEGVPPVLATPAALARVSDVVMIAVVDAKQVQAVLEGPDGLLAGAHSGLVVVLLSTVSLEDLKRLVAIAGAAGVALLDCGVTGGPASAPKGELICMLGGEDGVVERIRPVLEDFSEFVQHMGQLGAGMAAKIARNAIHYQVWRGGYEGALLASRAGVDLAKFAAVVERAATKPGASPTTWMTADTMNPPQEWPADQATLRRHVRTLQIKDLQAALDLAAQLKLQLPSAEAALQNTSASLGLPPETPEPAAAGDQEKSQDRFSAGLQMLEQVYGPGGGAALEAVRGSPFVAETAEHLFGEIWTRPQLSVRDRRLLVIGATAMLGRADLIEQQVAGALHNKELDAVQLEEAVLQLCFYVGMGNATAMYRGVHAALAKSKA